MFDSMFHLPLPILEKLARTDELVSEVAAFRPQLTLNPEGR